MVWTRDNIEQLQPSTMYVILRHTLRNFLFYHKHTIPTKHVFLGGDFDVSLGPFLIIDNESK